MDINIEYKQYLIQSCDSAFRNSLFARKDSDTLIEKIATNADFLAIYHKATPIGYAAIYLNDFLQRKAYITMIGVIPEYQHCHYGTALLTGCESLAIEKNMDEIRLEVSNDNKNAILFYQKNGFQFDGIASDNSKYMKKGLRR